MSHLKHDEAFLRWIAEGWSDAPWQQSLADEQFRSVQTEQRTDDETKDNPK